MAQAYATGTAAILGALTIEGYGTRIGAFVEIAPDDARGVSIGDLFEQRVALVPASKLAAADHVEGLVKALRELLVDVRIAQDNMRDAAKRDPRWEGCAEAIQPRVDAARAALSAATGTGDT